MSFHVVPLGLTGLGRAGPGLNRRGWGLELMVPGTGAWVSPRLAEVSAPSGPGRLVCQSLGWRQRQ